MDGLRAISVTFVLIGHLWGTRGAGTLDFGIGDYAHLGVVTFFVISGFLITNLLLGEYHKTGSVSLKLFYARRFVRIFPPAYTYLFVVGVLWASGVISLEARDMWHAASYTSNYEPARSWYVGHLWSLSVEEQFYLLWPFAFIFLKPRKAIWATVAVIALAPVARLGNRFLLIGTPYHDLPMFPMVADSLAMGCLFASIKDWLEGQEWYARLMKPGWSIVLLAMVLVVNRYGGYTVVSVFGSSITNLCLAILIHRSVYHADDRMGRVLNWKPIVTVGVLSYSLYLWQQPFLNRTSSAWISAFPENIVLAIVAAVASYVLLERPLMNMRQRLRPEGAPKPAKGPQRIAQGGA